MFMEICNINQGIRKWKQGVVISLMLLLSIILGTPVGNTEEQKKAITGEAKQSVEYVEVKTIPLYELFKTKEKWHATAYEVKQDKGKYPFENPQAKICFWHDMSRKKTLCFPSEDGQVKYQSVESIEAIPLKRNGDLKYGVLFITRNLSPTIGKVRLISIWVYNKQENKFVNLLPSIPLTDISEYKVFPVMKGEIGGIFVTADRIWEGAEPLYGGHHPFRIEIYQYSKSGMFKSVGGYETKKRYETVDILDDYGVIRDEIGNIQKYIREKIKK